jgi:hypothetical protein
MSNTPRLSGVIPGEAPNFGTMLGHAPDVLGRFGALYAEFWQGGRVSQSLKEMTRLRNARVTDCGF